MQPEPFERGAIYHVFEPIEAIALTPDEWVRGTDPIVRIVENGKSIIVR